MKETLKQRIETISEKLSSRIIQLSEHIDQYKEANEFDNAMICDIKRKELQMVLDNINEALK